MSKRHHVCTRCRKPMQFNKTRSAKKPICRQCRTPARVYVFDSERITWPSREFPGVDIDAVHRIPVTAHRSSP